MSQSGLFDTKRDSLEEFIREQMAGPNGCRGKFSYLYSEGEKETDSDEEVISTTPGSIYSTAILFPAKTSADDSDMPEPPGPGPQDEAPEDDEAADGENGPAQPSQEETDSDVSRDEDKDDEDISSPGRRFPQTIGLTCCVTKEALKAGNLSVNVSGRYYKRISGADRQKVCVNITRNETFDRFWEENEALRQHFVLGEDTLRINDIKADDLPAVKDLLKSADRAAAIRIAEELGVVKGVGNEDFRFLLSYRNYLYRQLRTVNDGKYLSPEDYKRYREGILRIEEYQSILSCFEDLLGMYDFRNFGFWRSVTFSKDLDLSGIPLSGFKGGKKVFRPDDYPALRAVAEDEVKTSRGDCRIRLDAWLQLSSDMRHPDDGSVYLKLLLDNKSTPFKESKRYYFSIVNEQVNRSCFFGIKGTVRSPFLIPYRKGGNYEDSSKAEDRLNYIYREIKDYGTGHLCSADWSKDSSGKVTEVFTEFLPSFETPDVEPVPRRKFSEYVMEDGSMVPAPYLEDTSALQFKRLSSFSDIDDKTITEELKSFVGAYGQWIAEMRGRTEGSEFGELNMDECQSDCDRMLSNITEILEKDSDAMRSFRLMNSAMFMQLWHNSPDNQKSLEGQRLRKVAPDFYEAASDEIFGEGQHAAWRPFQLAFILLNLDGIFNNPSDSGWSRRNELVDLVWFPTGGGKTEAYLGLIALCVINRRVILGAKGGGVCAIMRYTLRLLTTQQFQRALRLVMALELIRRWNEDTFGKDRISIGLYVGDASLPNKRKDLEKEARNWKDRPEGQNNTKIPLDRCPWCGSRLDYIDGGFGCTNRYCAFGSAVSSLPVRLCDEDIYSDPPSLIIGTVDKFASLAHKVSESKDSDSRRLFGHGLGFPPPDLIIQDELHLLLGPLGSAVSLFECAIDQLCAREASVNGKTVTLRPKIISSTATTRNTELQIRALYDRDVNIFPKNGLTHDDSFFAFYKREETGGEKRYVSKRKYLGIMPTGRTQMTTQMRLSAILFVHRAIFELEHGGDKDFGKVADNYFSVLSYYNSLKDVGKSDAQFFTEYSKYTKRLFKRVMRPGDLMDCHYSGDFLTKAELTGRLSGSEVNARFAEVGKSWDVGRRLPFMDEDGQWRRADVPPDYILATNMISAGLDVSRFNTMIVNSMPRNIAEYIQATSRIARSVKGLVLTLHNPYRSRDVSHFERFREFHEKLYFFVEPISITPFSKKSAEKYLPLCLATIVRHKFPELAANADASNISEKLRQAVQDTVRGYFVNRYGRTKGLDSELERQLLTEEQLQEIECLTVNALEEWVQAAKEHPRDLVYEKFSVRKTNDFALFTSPDDFEEYKSVSNWTVPKSLRIIEPEAVLKISVFPNQSQDKWR